MLAEAADVCARQALSKPRNAERGPGDARRLLGARCAAAALASFVATFAFAQVFNHSAKIVVFGLAGLAWSEHTGMMIVGIIGVVVGTRIGSQWMRRVDARLLDGLFAAAVTAGALRLLLGWVL